MEPTSPFDRRRRRRYRTEVPKVTFQPLDTAVELQAGESIFEAAQRNRVPVPTACGGKGTCGLCRVKILDGESALPPITREEKHHLGNTYFISKLRLSCRLRPTGDVVVQLPDLAKALRK
jgi:ferredoxin, 2Fe-2S